MGWQRVRHDWATFTFSFTFMKDFVGLQGEISLDNIQYLMWILSNWTTSSLSLFEVPAIGFLSFPKLCPKQCLVNSFSLEDSSPWRLSPPSPYSHPTISSTKLVCTFKEILLDTNINFSNSRHLQAKFPCLLKTVFNVEAAFLTLWS